MSAYPFGNGTSTSGTRLSLIFLMCFDLILEKENNDALLNAEI